MTCVQCGRELITLAAPRCPWCGEPVAPPAIPATFLAMLRECRATPLTIRFLVRKNLKAYAALGLLFTAIGTVYVLLDMPTLAVAVAGVWFGLILRDIGTFRTVVKTWPYQAAVMNWELIDRLSAGEQASNELGLKT